MLFFSVNLWALTKEEDNKIRQGTDNYRYKTVTTKEGLNFRIPEDMPIETRNGIQAPISFEEYLYGRFKQMDSRLKSIEMKLDNIEKLLASSKEEKQKLPTSR